VHSSMMLVLLTLPLGCACIRHSEPTGMSGLGFALGAQHIGNVKEALGPGELLHSGDAGTAETSICFQTDLGEVIVFASNDEMAGPDLELTGIRLHRAGPEDSDCRMLKLDSRIVLSNGLRLGLTRREVESAIGVPLDPDGTASSCTQVPFHKGTAEPWINAKGCFRPGEEPYYNICNTVTAKFETDKALSIELTRIRSVC
jgi:hypothetical protein